LERGFRIYGEGNKSIVKEEDEFSLQQWEQITKSLLRLSKVLITTCFKAINLISRPLSSKWMFKQLSFLKISCAEHFNCGRFDLSKLNLMFTNLIRSKNQVGVLIEVGKLIWVVWNLLLCLPIDSWSLSQVSNSHSTLNSLSTVYKCNITSIGVVCITSNTIF